MPFALRSSAGDLTTGWQAATGVDGTRMRSGTFDAGEQVGEWTTYDRSGSVHEVTKMKPKTTST